MGMECPGVPIQTCNSQMKPLTSRSSYSIFLSPQNSIISLSLHTFSLNLLFTECFHLKALPFTFLPSSRLCTFNYPLFHQNLPFSLSSIFLLCCFHLLSLYRHTGLILSERKGNVYFIQPFPLVLITTYPLTAVFHMQ